MLTLSYFIFCKFLTILISALYVAWDFKIMKLNLNVLLLIYFRRDLRIMDFESDLPVKNILEMLN